MRVSFGLGRLNEVAIWPIFVLYVDVGHTLRHIWGGNDFYPGSPADFSFNRRNFGHGDGPKMRFKLCPSRVNPGIIFVLAKQLGALAGCMGLHETRRFMSARALDWKEKHGSPCPGSQADLSFANRQREFLWGLLPVLKGRF